MPHITNLCKEFIYLRFNYWQINYVQLIKFKLIFQSLAKYNIKKHPSASLHELACFLFGQMYYFFIPLLLWINFALSHGGKRRRSIILCKITVPESSFLLNDKLNPLIGNARSSRQISDGYDWHSPVLPKYPKALFACPRQIKHGRVACNYVSSGIRFQAPSRHLNVHRQSLLVCWGPIIVFFVFLRTDYCFFNFRWLSNSDRERERQSQRFTFKSVGLTLLKSCSKVSNLLLSVVDKRPRNFEQKQ